MKLKENDLIKYIDSHQHLSRVDLCKGAGYEREFNEFFDAILKARQAPGDYLSESTTQGFDWYDSLTDTQRDLYDAIEDTCPEFSTLDAEHCQEFMDELAEHGITTADQFTGQYFYNTDSHFACREFAEWVVAELNSQKLDEGVTYDWQATWETQLKDRFFAIEFGDETYFMSKE